MAAFAVGDVVLVVFPYTDLSSSKVRPAFVVGKVDAHDCLLCMITSQGYSDTMAMPIPEKDFHSGGLGKSSFVRPCRLFVASTTIIRRKIGNFSPQFTEDVKDAITDWLDAQ